MKKISLFCLFIGLFAFANSIKSQTINKDEIYPFVKLSLCNDTLFILNSNVGLCVTELWQRKPVYGPKPLLVISDDIDYFLDNKKTCGKIVKTIKLN